ncbi:MAG: phosphoribosyltransferase family protein [Patescibacteria group bacterium]
MPQSASEPLSISTKWISKFKELRILWAHDGNIKRPHVVLSSGAHSSSFFNAELLTQDPSLLAEACTDMVTLLSEYTHGEPKFDYMYTASYIVGPAMGGVLIAHGIADALGRYRGAPCFSGYVRQEKGTMVFWKSHLPVNSVVILADDVFTTGGSLKRTATALVDANCTVLPVVMVLVNRIGSGAGETHQFEGRHVIRLMDSHDTRWLPSKCELCVKGSEAISPDGMENWKRLTARY